MKYTGKYKTMNSEILGHMVDILEYKSENNIPYLDCTRCGKAIKRRMFVVQNAETAVEEMYLGSECIKHFM